MSKVTAETKVARTVITQMTVENCRQHQRLVKEMADPLLVGLDAHDTILCE